MKKFALTTVIAFAISVGMMAPMAAAEQGDSISFKMVRSAGAAVCIPAKAHGTVTISDTGQVQNMHVEAFGLPASTQFTVFLLQVPNKPFGLSWYQGDILTDKKGKGVGDFTGIFGIETFIQAPGVAPAPKIFPDNATSNPATPPVQIYHMGMWFADPADSQKAGCGDTVTPFDGDHSAGIQVLNTSNFDDDEGPLLGLQ
jgi:hypothetical protein